MTHGLEIFIVPLLKFTFLKGNLEASADSCQKTVEIRENTLGENYSGLIAILTSCAQVLGKMKKKDEADKIIKRSEDIKKNNEASHQ